MNEHERPSVTVFFSSQNETGMREGRRFVEKSLRRALDELAAERRQAFHLLTVPLTEELKPGPSDSTDRPGESKPEPSATRSAEQTALTRHYARLEEAALVVADLTAVAHTRNGRKVPSPEVMRDLGWALARLGPEKVITVAHAAKESAIRAELTYTITSAAEAQAAFQELTRAFRQAVENRLS
ncbi:hypothetical protein [Oecophyllibacter saccharovorans]|uniref:hypothetical protein n=1 Tax=Oecophyllibacter saccharovorans TaxID=2558360 RepID=UPI00116B1AFD|nr:hypothetical protein [Oecophyllibacter saccharovorans]TPW35097.1 hypothetical protein E3203_06400 [Oecophyllibacter saccharovorans]